MAIPSCEFDILNQDYGRMQAETALPIHEGEGAFSRTEMLIGLEGLSVLAAARVAVFGLGGVGGYALEALVRSGIGHMDLIDHDRITVSNLNRQLLATSATIGRYKVDVAGERARSINPDIQIEGHACFYLPESADQFVFSDYDYVIDAIDTVTAKLDLAIRCHEASVPLISCMGAGNKMDPTAFRVCDIFETEMDPLARVLRRELRKRGIPALKVVASREKPLEGKAGNASFMQAGKRTPGSIAFVPSVAGLFLAAEVVKDLLKRNSDVS